MERVEYEDWMVGCGPNGCCLGRDQWRWGEECFEQMLHFVCGERNTVPQERGNPVLHEYVILVGADGSMPAVRFALSHQPEMKIDDEHPAMNGKPYRDDRGPLVYAPTGEAALMDILNHLDEPTLFLYERWLYAKLRGVEVDYRELQAQYTELFGIFGMGKDNVYQKLHGRSDRGLGTGIVEDVRRLLLHGDQVQSELKAALPKRHVRVPFYDDRDGWVISVVDATDVDHLRAMWKQTALVRKRLRPSRKR